MEVEDKNPVVFISYSHESKEHQDRVLMLANKLRSEGIDCILDQYEESPPEGWPKWMDRSIEKSEFVLVVCTKTYHDRAIGEDEKGNGIKWESNLIYQHLYNSGSVNEKFIPIIFNDSNLENIPKPLQGSTFYNIEDSESYDKLYWRLRGLKTEKPELGALRKLPEKERKTLFISDLIDQQKWDLANWKNGVSYLWSQTGLEPPIITLFFESIKQGKNLFKDLRDKLGEVDELDRLRVTIVEGEVPHQRNGYFVVIGENFDATEQVIEKEEASESIEYIAINQRFHRVYIEGESPNLKKFKQEFEKHNCYYIAPGIQTIDENGKEIGETDFDSMILKKKIEFRQYEDIPFINDPESILKTEDVQKHKF